MKRLFFNPALVLWEDQARMLLASYVPTLLTVSSSPTWSASWWPLSPYLHPNCHTPAVPWLATWCHLPYMLYPIYSLTLCRSTYLVLCTRFCIHPVLHCHTGAGTAQYSVCTCILFPCSRRLPIYPSLQKSLTWVSCVLHGHHITCLWTISQHTRVPSYLPQGLHHHLFHPRSTLSCNPRQAEPLHFDAPGSPASGLHWGKRLNKLMFLAMKRLIGCLWGNSGIRVLSELGLY